MINYNDFANTGIVPLPTTVFPGISLALTTSRRAHLSAAKISSKDRIQILQEASLGAEDFSLYLQEAPGSMFRLGVGALDKENHPLHHPQFEADESAIVTGVVTLAYAAYKYWHQN